jgi:hypothetical protein
VVVVRVRKFAGRAFFLPPPKKRGGGRKRLCLLEGAAKQKRCGSEETHPFQTAPACFTAKRTRFGHTVSHRGTLGR